MPRSWPTTSSPTRAGCSPTRSSCGARSTIIPSSGSCCRARRPRSSTRCAASTSTCAPATRCRRSSPTSRRRRRAGDRRSSSCAPTWTRSRCRKTPACRTRARSTARCTRAGTTRTSRCSWARRGCSTERRAELPGTVRFMFQPGEEGFHGARHMIDEGLLDEPDVDAAFALHVAPNLPSGSISTRGGALMASADVIEIVVTGKGGHASTPYLANDPMPVAAEIVQALQVMVTRRINAFDPGRRHDHADPRRHDEQRDPRVGAHARHAPRGVRSRSPRSRPPASSASRPRSRTRTRCRPRSTVVPGYPGHGQRRRVREVHARRRPRARRATAS